MIGESFYEDFDEDIKQFVAKEIGLLQNLILFKMLQDFQKLDQVKL